jgi:hypothetical protein
LKPERSTLPIRVAGLRYPVPGFAAGLRVGMTGIVLGRNLATRVPEPALHLVLVATLVSWRSAGFLIVPRPPARASTARTAP